MNGIGSLSEFSLHKSLKSLYSQPGDEVEYSIEGWVVDILAQDEIIEIQTGNFGKMKRKLQKLLPKYPVRVVFPIAVEHWVVRLDSAGLLIGKRKSPKKARVEELFAEMVNLGAWVISEKFTLEVVFVSDEVFWQDDGKGSWRRKKWSIVDRKLLAVHGSQQFQLKPDYLAMVPPTLPEQFTSSQLAVAARISTRLAGKMLYFLKQLEVVTVVGRKGKAFVYQKNG